MSNVLAPSVYIKLVEREADNFYITLLLKDILADGNFSWFDDQLILDTFKVVVEHERQRASFSLRELKQKYRDIKYRFFNNGEEYNFEYTVVLKKMNNAPISCYCTDGKVFGETTVENVTFESNTSTVNKCLDLNLLEVFKQIKSAKSTTQSVYLTGPYINYSTNKQAAIGFIFNLEKYLNSTSEEYAYFSSSYGKEILNNSYIELDSCFLEKRNVSLENMSYEVVEGRFTSTKLSPYEFFISIADLKEPVSNKYLYDLRLNVKINNYVDQFLNQKFITTLQTHINILNAYKSQISILSQDNIEPFKTYFNEFYTADSFKQLCLDISSISSFYGDRDRSVYSNLLASCLHPLNTNLEILEKIILFVNNLLQTTRNYISLGNISDGIVPTKSGNKFLTTVTREYTSALDYTYDYGTGYEVFSSTPYEQRVNISASFQNITPQEYFVRKFSEVSKYSTNYGQENTQNLSTFGISQVDIRENSYDLINTGISINANTFNQCYIRTKEYLEHTFSYRTPETFVFQLADSGLNIDTITDASNSSKNNLKKSLLFDPNFDSQQKSLEFLTSTGVQTLYFLLDETKPVEAPVASTIFQEKASRNNISPALPVFVFTGSVVSDPTAKARGILYYNTLHTGSVEASGSINSLYADKPVGSSVLFASNLRHFNEYYLVKNGIDQPPSNSQEEAQQTEIVTKILGTSGNVEEIGRTIKEPRININIASI